MDNQESKKFVKTNIELKHNFHKNIIVSWLIQTDYYSVNARLKYDLKSTS